MKTTDEYKSRHDRKENVKIAEENQEHRQSFAEELEKLCSILSVRLREISVAKHRIKVELSKQR